MAFFGTRPHKKWISRLFALIANFRIIFGFIDCTKKIIVVFLSPYLTERGINVVINILTKKKKPIING